MPKPRTSRVGLTRKVDLPGIDDSVKDTLRQRVDTTITRLPDGKFAPGHPGVAGPGRIAGQLTLTELVKIYQAKPLDEVREIYKEGKITAIVATACRVVLESAERTGSVEVLKERWNRTEGKVPDRLQVQSQQVVFRINIPGDDDPMNTDGQAGSPDSYSDSTE